MKRSEIVFGILRIPSDAIAIAGSLLLSYWLRTKNIDLIPGVAILDTAKTLPNLQYYTEWFVIPSMLLFIVIAALLKLYMIRVTLSAFREEARIALTTIVWVGIIMGWFFFVRKQLFFSRALLLHATVFVAVTVSIGRMMLTIVQRTLLKRGIGVRSVTTIGAQPPPNHVALFLKNDPRYHYLGHIASTEAKYVSAISSAMTDKRADLIIQTDPSTSEETNVLIDFCRSNHIGYAFLPPVLCDVPHLLSVYRFGSIPILRFSPTPLDGWGAVFKRTGDIAIAAILLILLSPIFILIALIIKIDSS